MKKQSAQHDPATLRHIHIVGIAGVGMSALAIFCKELGIVVSGSDDGEEYITLKTLQAARIEWHNNFDAKHISQDTDIVVATNAHGAFTDNPETVEAKRLGIPVLSLRQAIARFAQKKKVIAIAGTHGKTTTTAMVATILDRAGLDPSWVPIGTATIPTLPANGHAGKGEWFITEADEYFDRPKELGGKPNFLYLEPQIAVITSVDWDHPDVYPSKKNYLAAFKKFLKQVRRGGLVVAYGDSPDLRKLSKSSKSHIWWYGRKHLGPNLKLQVSGLHNELNATAAARVAHEVGVDQKTILAALSEFQGTERRLQQKDERNGIIYLDDYAHHPTAIKMTIEAIREKYSNRRVVIVFEPHTFSRTKALKKEFADSLATADHAIISDVYPSREKPSVLHEESVLSAEVAALSPAKIEHVAGDLLAIAEQTRSLIHEGDVLCTMGAGSIYKLHDLLNGKKNGNN